MLNRLLIILLLALFCRQDCFSQDDPFDIALRNEVALYGQARVLIPLPGKAKLNELSRNVSISSIKDKYVEIVISPLSAEWFILQGIDFELIPRPDTKGIVSSSNLEEAMEWNTYPTYTQYVDIMNNFEIQYPSLCKLDTIGTSINGKLVLVLKISDNPGINESEPEVFYSSTIHGDETGGFILMMRLADYLLENYNSLDRVKNLVDNLEIWINPLANPDGTYRTGDVMSSPTRYNANGYDLNRNFPDPNSPNAVRQKETLDMMSFMRRHKFILSANFHAGVEVVNYPWDRWPRLHADDEWFKKISRKYADTVHQHSPSGYMDFKSNGVTNGYDWYYIYGGRQDYITWELQGREVTIELDNSYVTPVADLDPLWEYNRRSLLGYIENALYGIHGHVKDILTSEPVPARVFISDHDIDSSHIYADTLTGDFVRLLEPGTWDLVFTAAGYLNKEVKGIVISDEEKTAIVVEMVPVLNPVDTVETDQLLIYPNPADDQFKLILPPGFTGRINITVLNHSGIKIVNYDTEAFEDIPLFIDVSALVPGSYILIVENLKSKQNERSRFVVVH